VANDCPLCQAKLHNRFAWFWRPWVCRGCGAKLRFAPRPRQACFAVIITGGILLVGGGAVYSREMTIVGGLLATGAAFAFPWVDCVVVVSRGPFCTNCEYDLTAGEGDACPECAASRLSPHA
jgi:hypothetical protein